MKILFLDFDGVLHAASANPAGGHFSRLPLLEALLVQPSCADVQIVISSSWRDTYSLARLRQYFSNDLRGRVIDVTPTLEEYDSDHFRYEEIQAWLDAHPAVDRWVALDDDVEGFPAHWGRHVVFTDPRIGVSKQNLMALQLVLEAPAV